MTALANDINELPHELLRVIFTYTESSCPDALTDTRATMPTVCKLWYMLYWPPELRAFLQSRAVNRAPETRMYQIIKHKLAPLYPSGAYSTRNEYHNETVTMTQQWIMYAIEHDNWDFIEHLYAQAGTLTQCLVELAAAVPECYKLLRAKWSAGARVIAPFCNILLTVRGGLNGALDYAQREKLLSAAGFLAGICALYAVLGGEPDFASYLMHTMSTAVMFRPSKLAQYLLCKYKRTVPSALAAKFTERIPNTTVRDCNLLCVFRCDDSIAGEYIIGGTIAKDIPAFKYSHAARKLHVLLKYADWNEIAEHKVAVDVVHLVHYLAGEYEHAAHEAIAMLQAQRALCVWERPSARKHPCNRCTNANADANMDLPPAKKLITAAQLALDYMQKQMYSTSSFAPVFARLLQDLADEHVIALAQSMRSERATTT